MCLAGYGTLLSAWAGVPWPAVQGQQNRAATSAVECLRAHAGTELGAAASAAQALHPRGPAAMLAASAALHGRGDFGGRAGGPGGGPRGAAPLARLSELREEAYCKVLRVFVVQQLYDLVRLPRPRVSLHGARRCLALPASRCAAAAHHFHALVPYQARDLPWRVSLRLRLIGRDVVQVRAAGSPGVGCPSASPQAGVLAGAQNTEFMLSKLRAELHISDDRHLQLRQCVVDGDEQPWLRCAPRCRPEAWSLPAPSLAQFLAEFGCLPAARLQAGSADADVAGRQPA